MSRLATRSRRNGFVIPRFRRGRLYGLSVRLRLLPTPPCLRLANAVPVDYGVTTPSRTDFHRADLAASRTHMAATAGTQRPRT